MGVSHTDLMMMKENDDEEIDIEEKSGNGGDKRNKK